jgi:hypothetical protein
LDKPPDFAPQQTNIASGKGSTLKHNSNLSIPCNPRVPGEPDVIEQLLSANMPEQIVEICADAFSVRRDQIEPGVVREVKALNWPISADSMLPIYLSEFAFEFIAAKNDQRFPKATRPTNRLKQLWFLSRARGSGPRSEDPNCYQPRRIAPT